MAMQVNPSIGGWIRDMGNEDAVVKYWFEKDGYIASLVHSPDDPNAEIRISDSRGGRITVPGSPSIMLSMTPECFKKGINQ